MYSEKKKRNIQVSSSNKWLSYCQYFMFCWFKPFRMWIKFTIFFLLFYWNLLLLLLLWTKYRESYYFLSKSSYANPRQLFVKSGIGDYVSGILVCVKCFGTGTNLLCQIKNWFTYCAVHKLFVPVSLVSAGTKIFVGAQKANQFLVWPKKFGPAQNILCRHKTFCDL